jgi:hypothetical protein
MHLGIELDAANHRCPMGCDQIPGLKHSSAHRGFSEAKFMMPWSASELSEIPTREKSTVGDSRSNLLIFLFATKTLYATPQTTHPITSFMMVANKVAENVLGTIGSETSRLHNSVS